MNLKEWNRLCEEAREIAYSKDERRQLMFIQAQRMVKEANNELLAALKNLVNDYERMVPFRIDEAKAAIAKAEGAK